jgi:hypothetical protein
MRRIGIFDPIARLSVFLLPKVALLILAATAVWIWRKPRHEGLYLWCLALAALLLENNHLVTGMNLTPGHWRYVWGPALGILFLTMLAQLIGKPSSLTRPAATAAMALAVLLEVGIGITLRTIEVTRSLNGNRLLNGYSNYIEQTRVSGPQPLPIGAVVAGDEAFCNLATIFNGTIPFAGYPAFLSLSLTDSAWEFREALNARLLGLSESEFQQQAVDAGRRYAWGQSADPRKDSQRVEKDLMRAYAALDNPPDRLIDNFDIGYIALPAARSDPDYLKRGWTLSVAGPVWRIWTRKR